MDSNCLKLYPFGGCEGNIMNKHWWLPFYTSKLTKHRLAVDTTMLQLQWAKNVFEFTLWRTKTQLHPHQWAKLSHEENLYYFPWNTGCLTGIRIMVHEIIISNPLSGIIPSKYPKQPRLFFHCEQFLSNPFAEFSWRWKGLFMVDDLQPRVFQSRRTWLWLSLKQEWYPLVNYIT